MTRTKTSEILFEYDDSGNTYLAVEPRPTGGKAQTWFKAVSYTHLDVYKRQETPWAKHYTMETIRGILANSLCMGVYHAGVQVGFARCVTAVSYTHLA